MDEFLGKPFLTCCLVSVLLKPGEKAENFLRYSVVIENILPETELFIHCSLNQFSTGEITTHLPSNTHVVFLGLAGANLIYILSSGGFFLELVEKKENILGILSCLLILRV